MAQERRRFFFFLKAAEDLQCKWEDILQEVILLGVFSRNDFCGKTNSDYSMQWSTEHKQLVQI